VKCERCGQKIPAGDEMDHNGQILCEECYMQALSPARACDPWAVRSAQTLSQMDDEYSLLSETQTKIIRFLEETGGATPEMIAKTLEMTLPELERESVILRHMEKVRAQIRDGQKVICLW
jgi:hypothetical protein